MPGSQNAQPAFFSLGLTGGIGSGKSTVAALFAEHGAGIVDMDDIAHRLTAPGGKAMNVIRREFGDAYVSKDGSLDRARMRELVFQEPSAREKLENILHPMIRQHAWDQAVQLKTDYVIFVIPLLTEQPAWQEMASRIQVV
ncbi:MAG: dephospho-CoA kinase, partial [Oxalobacter sp.]|nr:dephospho-CoA kinase [Oxalobacter sp.]